MTTTATAKLSDTAAQALRDALVKKGQRKSRLLAQAPPSNTLAYAAWQGAMLACTPYKASLAALLFMTPEQRAVHKEIVAFFDVLPRDLRIAMDRDRQNLEALGVW
jgi:hypothetical protein